MGKGKGCGRGMEQGQAPGLPLEGLMCTARLRLPWEVMVVAQGSRSARHCGMLMG